MSSKYQRFWSEFLKDPEGLKSSQSFPLLLWQGITPSSARKDIWRSKAKSTKFVLARNIMPEEDEELFLLDAESEIEDCIVRGLIPAVVEENLEDIKQIVLDFSAHNHIEAYQQGTAALTGIILNIVESKKATISLLQVVYDATNPFRKNKNALHNRVLTLADLLVQEAVDVANHFNNCEFDVVDLNNIVCTWIDSWFATYFTDVAVVRMLDIIFFEGAKHCMGFVFGLIKLFSPKILEQEPSDLVGFLTDIPELLTSEMIESAMLLGYEAVRSREKKISEMRKAKDWAKCIEFPGVLTFVAGVGDPTMLKRSRSTMVPGSGRYDEKNDLKDGDDDDEEFEEEKEDGDDDELFSKKTTSLQIVMNENVALAKPDLLIRLEKVRGDSEDAKTRSVIAEAQAELRRQTDSIQKLQSEINKRDEKWRDMRRRDSNDVSEVSSIESDVSSINSVDDMLTTTPRTDDDSSAGTETISPRATNDPIRGTVKYSKLFQHQQFPCLYMEGYLLKARKKGIFKRRGATGLFGNLHRRFFVLQGSFLTYFKSHRNSKPSRDLSADMRGRTISKLDKHEFGKYGFQVSELGSSECMYLLFASNADERNVWVQVLQAAAES